MRSSRWMPGAVALVAGLVAGICTLFARYSGAKVPAPAEVVILFTGDTAGELKGCG